MGLMWEQVVIESADAVRLGRWWAEALQWVVVDEEDGVLFEIRPTVDETPGIFFITSPAERTGKNRLHLDFRPDDQGAELERLLAHGATRVNIGQGRDVPWIVLRDPEGNEFCLLGAAH
ncbi:MAG: VOC family protein [Actinomycetota bacterium]